MKVTAVIPARYSATRLPGKPLADIQGKPMIQWVYEHTREAKGVDRVVVATDDDRVAEAVRAFGGEVVMTSSELNSGTDRVAAVAALEHGSSDDIWINVQGDEPEMPASTIEAALALVRDHDFEIGTAMCPIEALDELDQQSVVKVIADQKSRAIYFSRHPIPYSRGPRPEKVSELSCRRHLGLYVYRRSTLMEFCALPPSSIERGEVLEQLRAIEAGIPIGIVEVPAGSFGIDTPADLERVRKQMSRSGGSRG